MSQVGLSVDGKRTFLRCDERHLRDAMIVEFGVALDVLVAVLVLGIFFFRSASSSTVSTCIISNLSRRPAALRAQYSAPTHPSTRPFPREER